MATRTDFLRQGVVRRHRALRGLKPSSEKIGRNVRAHSFRFFSDEVFFAWQLKDAHQNLERKNRTRRVRVVRRVRLLFVRKARTKPRTIKIDACSHGITRLPVRLSVRLWVCISAYRAIYTRARKLTNSRNKIIGAEKSKLTWTFLRQEYASMRIFSSKGHG